MDSLKISLSRHKMPQAAALTLLALALAPLMSSAQDLERHGEVTTVDGQEVTVQLKEGLSVSAGTAGTIYTTTTVGGEERPVPVAQVEVSGVEGRTATVRVTNQTEPPETGFLASFETVQRLGTLVVEAEPTGATIRVDGNAAGTGTAREQVEAGTYAVVADAEGYESARRQVEVEPGATRRISFSLQQASGQLVVEARPDSARILVDGEPQGRGRAEATLSPGTYSVAVRAGGHVPIDTTAEVSVGEQATVDVSLRRASGQLVVTTEPDSATVEIDGRRAGPAPVVRDLPAGEHEVRATADGYQSTSRNVTVVAGEREQVALTLDQASRRAGTLVVETDPGGATVRVDGETIGTAPVREELSPGEYRVEVEREGYEGAEQVVRISDGEERRVRLSLRRPLQVRVADVHEGPVRNVRVRRKGETLVVTYDLVGEEDEYEVALQLSTDEGRTFRQIQENIKGAVGQGVKPENLKRITWAALRGFPKGIAGTKYRLRVQVTAKPSTTEEVRVGITGGIVSSSFPSRGSRVVDEPGEVVSRRLGYSVGVFLTFDPPGSLALQPEILYLQEGATLSYSTNSDPINSHVSINRKEEYIHFVEFPVLVKYKLLSEGTLSLGILGGPAGGFSATAVPTGLALGFTLGAEGGVALGSFILSLGIRYEADVTALSGGSSTPRPRSFLLKANLSF
jgi:hypothetical protein